MTMRSLLVLLLCFKLGTASILRHGRELPPIGLANASPRPGLAAKAPESVQSVHNYVMAKPTPLPAALNGVYCRGAACQYRVASPQLTLPTLVAPPDSPSEFCRGVGCSRGAGTPGDPNQVAFSANCAHLFSVVEGGMTGEDTKRNVAQVHDSFMIACKRRVGTLDSGACARYSDTFLAALSSKVNQPTVGGTAEVCTDTYLWLGSFKQAEVDLKLTAAALPKGVPLTAGSSARALKWQEYASAQRPQTSKLASLSAEREKDTLRGAPKYNQNPSAKDSVGPQGGTMYQIAAASADGTVPPLEVAGDLFTYCSNQFSEIMLGFMQTAPATVQMTKDWCAWQAAVSSWVGQQQELGRPDWSQRTCSGMGQLVAFALKDNLSDKEVGLSSQQVCKKIFLAIGSVHMTDAIVQEAFQTSLRGAPSSGMPAADDVEMKKLAENAQRYSDQIFNKLRGQKAAYKELKQVKMDSSSFDANNIQNQPPAAAPDLPRSSDLDPAAL